jgi:hypothetical protein
VAGDFARFRLGNWARIGAEFGIDSQDEDRVTVRLREEQPWQIEMSPDQARKLARRLAQAARLLDPKKK